MKERLSCLKAVYSLDIGLFRGGRHWTLKFKREGERT